ncbi:MAG: beta-galactosidase, partial [Maribacter sp.]|nr:beta-galactosidase [Maribacter sp.]
EGFEVKFDADKGSLTSIDYGNGNLLLKGIEANFWRATIDNDFGYNMPKMLKPWNDATKNQKLLRIGVQSGKNNSTIEELKMTQSPFKVQNGNARVTTTYDLPDVNGKVGITYDVNDKGEIKVTTELSGIKEDLPVIPRFGNNFIIRNEYQRVNWYGRGPHENYQDRKTSAMVGTYDSKVEDLYFPYIRPQENGNRADVRWVTFTNETGTGIGIYAPQLFEFSAHHQYNSDFDPGETKQQRHTVDIKKRELVNINIDYKQMGVGGDNSWGFMALDKYQIKPKDLSYSYVIKPLK